MQLLHLNNAIFINSQNETPLLSGQCPHFKQLVLHFCCLSMLVLFKPRIWNQRKSHHNRPGNLKLGLLYMSSPKISDLRLKTVNIIERRVYSKFVEDSDDFETKKTLHMENNVYKTIGWLLFIFLSIHLYRSSQVTCIQQY